MKPCSDETWQWLVQCRSLVVSKALLLAANIEPEEDVLAAFEAVLAATYHSEKKQSARRALEGLTSPDKVVLLLAMHDACDRTGFDYDGPSLTTYKDATLYNRGSMAAEDGTLHHCHVKPADFALFCQSRGWSIPSGLARLVRPSDTPAGRPRGLVWPWGQYETEMLRHLHAAALRWWVKYDRSDHTTAPTQEEVRDWLVSARGLSKKKAEAIAAVLHTDDPLPKGPRR